MSMQPAAHITLCSPGHGLACFACCPPIRPPGYDHLPWKSSLRRLFIDTTAAVRAGRLPDKVMLGFWCQGLGFLDPKGRTIGCLLHPAQNNGQDLRGPTGYQEKCARESCAQSRAFAVLEPETANKLAGLCRGMDSFAFSSGGNPLMRLLAFGPVVAAAVFELKPEDLGKLKALPWLDGLEPGHGWLLGCLTQTHGPSLLEQSGTSGRVQELAQNLAKRIGPPPPLNSGEPLRTLCDEWEARFWKAVSHRLRARPAELGAWRGFAEDLI